VTINRPRVSELNPLIGAFLKPEPSHKPISVEITAANFRAGPIGTQLPTKLRRNQYTTAETIPGHVPNMRKATTTGISATSNFKNVIGGNGKLKGKIASIAARHAKAAEQDILKVRLLTMPYTSIYHFLSTFLNYLVTTKKLVKRLK
jgi:hypothetical protein